MRIGFFLILLALSPARAEQNIALRILEMEGQVRSVTPEQVAAFNAVIEDASARIQKLPGKNGDRWDRLFAERALRSIDQTLIDRGFVYPANGAVDLLADSLTPFQMTETSRRAVESRDENGRRREKIAARFPGPFFAADCDTASVIYLGVAEKLNLPIHLVVIPSFNRHAGHAFVRWHEGAHQLNWETTEGAIRSDTYYRERWSMRFSGAHGHELFAELTREEAIGFEHYSIATQLESRREYEAALRELAASIERFPNSLDARRQYAWIASTAPNLAQRHTDEAIAHAQFIVQRLDDPDAHDTLAAAYASAGKFDLAIAEERIALRHSARLPQFEKGYRTRLRLYEQGKVYRQVDIRRE